MRYFPISCMLVCSASPTLADEAADWRTLATVEDAHSGEHLSQTGGDPWLVSSSASLFTRPSLFEGVKLSNDTTTDDKSTYSLAVSAAVITGRPISPFVDGVQLSGAYDVTDKVVSLGMKWSVDSRDVRLVRSAQIQRIAAEAKRVYEACEPSSTLTRDAFEQRLRECEGKENEKRTELYEEHERWRPSFSLAAGSGYSFEEDRRDKSSVNLAADITGPVGPTKLSVTANAEWNQLPPDMDFDAIRSRVGGGLQLQDTLKFGLPITLAAGGKLFACVSDDCGKDSSLELTVGIGIQIQKTTQVGITVKWAGSDGTFRDAVGGLAFSYSFVPPKSE
jgi:hypothetical protein